MRIVIDGQILQSAGLHDESFEFLSEMLVGWVAEWRTHEVFLILSGRASARTTRIRADFGRVLTGANIRSWYGIEPLERGTTGVTWQHRSAQLIREGLLASLDPDVVVVPLSTAFAAQDGVFSNGLLHDHPTLVFVYDALATEARRFVAGADAAARAGTLEGPGRSTTVLAQSPGELRTRLNAAIERVKPSVPRSAVAGRPRLAFVSPLPPERSGISFYSAELLPALASHYEIDLIVDQRRVEQGAWRDGMRVRDVKWFAANARGYDRILYQFGNSGYHRHMFALLREHPGVVVLHDFFLSGIVSRMHRLWPKRAFWLEELYASHGYPATVECLLAKHAEDVIWTYPCSGSVLEDATGVIVHSESTRSLARHWHGAEAWRRIAVVPHMRAAQHGLDRDEARRALGFGADDFVVCSFGVLGTTKLNHRLLDAWLASRLARDPACKLVFAGANEVGAYGRDIAGRAKGAGGRIQVTGWLDEERYQQYLAACDLAVQLRSRSRGETSGTALDCMRHGLPLIVNAHGSMAELPRDAVHLLADAFEDRDLVAALERMRNDARHRAELGGRAAAFVRLHHDPVQIAARYAAAIETFAALPRTALVRLPEALAGSGQGDRNRAADRAIAASATLSVRPAIAARQLFVDISAMVKEDLRTGIQRVARALLKELLAHPPAGFRIEPVYASGSGFRYARRFTLGFLGARPSALKDAAIEPRSGDVYFMPDLAHESVIRNRATYRALRDHGVSVNFLVHDLLPVQFPDYFPSYAAPLHAQWLEVIAEADRAIGVSQSVAKELADWCKASDKPHNPHLEIVHSHHGADLAATKPTKGLPGGAATTLRLLKSAPSFLMVGTVEPRKGHAQVLDAFELLWAAGREEALVIVGKPGWMVKPLVKRLAHHAERNRRLFWIENASDEYLARIYESCAGLIAASYGEGFGLPLIEAATYGLPVIARDIPVFREVAGEHAYFFEAATAAELAASIEAWTRLNREGKAPQSGSMPRLTWAESAENLKRLLLGWNG